MHGFFLGKSKKYIKMPGNGALFLLTRGRKTAICMKSLAMCFHIAIYVVTLLELLTLLAVHFTVGLTTNNNIIAYCTINSRSVLGNYSAMFYLISI